MQEARSAHQQALDKLETKQELFRRNPGIVPRRDIESSRSPSKVARPRSRPPPRQKRVPRRKYGALLPAEKASARPATQAEVELAKTIIRAGVAGRVEQFGLRVGDIVNPLMRPAGVLIPEGAGRRACRPASGRLRLRS